MLENHIGAQNIETSFKYDIDAQGLLIEKQQAKNSVAFFQYDQFGRVAGFTDEASVFWSLKNQLKNGELVAKISANDENMATISFDETSWEMNTSKI